MAGPDLARVGERQQALVERAEDALRALGLVDGQVRAGDRADEQRVPGEHRPRLRAARGVDQRERRVLGPVAGRVQRAHGHVAERELPAVVERLVLVLGRGEPVDVDRRAGRDGEPAVPGDVVGVVVGLEDVLDPHAHVARQRQVLLDVELGVDDGRDVRVLVADQVRRAAKVVVRDLAEDHAAPCIGEPYPFGFAAPRLYFRPHGRRAPVQRPVRAA
jgi:hypothetical protein